MPDRKHNTEQQKRLKGTYRACRDAVNLQGEKVGKVAPPESFTEHQCQIWQEFYDTLDQHNVLSGLDIFGLNCLVLAYERVVNNSNPSIADIRVICTLLGKFGLLPAERGNLSLITKKQESALAELRKRRVA